jgi:hypothetical protein
MAAEGLVVDLIYLAVTTAFFSVAGAYVLGCFRLSKQKQETRDVH